MKETQRLRHVMPLEQRSGLLSSSYGMHQEVATLKHYLKVVPFQYVFLDGERQHTYLYKANYNEYKPRRLEWYEGKADAYVDTDLVPNAAFHYDISPVMVVMTEETQSFSSFVTKICAVIGGIYTVVGLLDNVKTEPSALPLMIAVLVMPAMPAMPAVMPCRAIPCCMTQLGTNGTSRRRLTWACLTSFAACASGLAHSLRSLTRSIYRVRAPQVVYHTGQTLKKMA